MSAPRVGILGAGQLARMAAIAAARLGVEVRVWDPSPAGCARPVAARYDHAPWDEPGAAARFADGLDAVSVETENVPAELLERLAELVPVRPGAQSVRIAQDRALEKRAADACRIACAPRAIIASLADLEAARGALSGRLVLKTCRSGYDGKGQRVVGDPAKLGDAWRALGGVRCLAESWIDFEREISVVLARGHDGQTAAYPIAANDHTRDHVLRATTAPAPDLAPALALEAERAALALADELDHVGVLAVEFFVARDGALLFNEMAPRPHNSGHWTIEGCATSQFENQIRAALGWPLGSTEALFACRMTNLLGDEALDVSLRSLGARHSLHLYGKEVRPGRKVGHINVRTGPPAPDRRDAPRPTR